MALGTDRRSYFFFSPPAHLYAVTYDYKYDWNIVNCDVKQPIHLTSQLFRETTPFSRL